jgi:hypothetical protein
VLIGSNQNGKRSRASGALFELADVEPPVYEVGSNLPYRICVKRGKPVFLPQGKSFRKERRKECGQETVKQANALL